jgi:prepilin-type N-terminal cleavage/methylation domain-containing protein
MKNQGGYTLIELLVSAAIIGILLAIAIPNLIKARISANEANARKAMQTLRDAEAEYAEMDLDGNSTREYTLTIGNLSTERSLRCPSFLLGLSACTEQDSLIDSSFENALDSDGAAPAGCPANKAGYCIKVGDTSDFGSTDFDFGWEAGFIAFDKTGRKDFSIYGDGTVRCTLASLARRAPSNYDADRQSPGCDD